MVFTDEFGIGTILLDRGRRAEMPKTIVYGYRDLMEVIRGCVAGCRLLLYSSRLQCIGGAILKSHARTAAASNQKCSCAGSRV